MVERQSPVTEDELHAFVDGELPSDRMSAVEDWLAAHPDDAARVGGWRLQAEAIRARFNKTANETIPARLKIEELLRSGRNWRTIAAAVIAAAFLVGGIAGWMARSTTEVVAAVGDPADDLAQRALAAHKLYIGEIRHPVEVGAAETHLMPWLSRRIGTTLRQPDFSAFDLKLMGGRLLPGEDGPAALLMYENSSGDRITFYISKLQQPQMAFRYYTSDNVAAIRWVVSDYGYVVSGPADKMRLKELARAAFEQLENRAPPPHPGRSSQESVISRQGG
jgi:anti-sigma factor RsiW